MSETENIAKTHDCAMCGGALVELWDDNTRAYMAVCGVDHSHTGFLRQHTLTEMHKEGVALPAGIAGKVEKGRQKRMMQKSNEGPPPTAGPGTIIISEVTTGRPAPLEIANRAIAWARSCGFVPELGHICLYFGQPSPTIEGLFYKFRRQNPGGRVESRPLNQIERMEQNIAENVEAWVAKAYTSSPVGVGQTEVVAIPGADEGIRLTTDRLLGWGFGYASRDNWTQLYRGVSEKWATAQRRAEKRAEEDCLKKAVLLELADGA